MSSFIQALMLPFMHNVDFYWDNHLKVYSADHSETDTADERATSPKEILQKFVFSILTECDDCENSPVCPFGELCNNCYDSEKRYCFDCSDPRRTCDKCNGDKNKQCTECEELYDALNSRKPCPYTKLREFVDGICSYEELHAGVDGESFYTCYACNTTKKQNCECEPFNCACGDALCYKCAINKYWESQPKDATEKKKPEIKRLRLADLASKRIDLTADESDEEEEKEDDEAEADESSRRVRPRIEQATQEPEEGELTY